MGDVRATVQEYIGILEDRNAELYKQLTEASKELVEARDEIDEWEAAGRIIKTVMSSLDDETLGDIREHVILLRDAVDDILKAKASADCEPLDG